MKIDLNIKQRFFVVGIYLSIIIGIGYYFSNGWVFLIDSNDKLNLVLIVTALALILGTYISEPYFSKPIDVITRWVAIFLFLLGLNDKKDFLFYDYWIWVSIIFTVVALLLILLHGFEVFKKYQKVAIDIICKISRPDIVFFLLYQFIVISFFKSRYIEFPILIGFGFLLFINKPIVKFTKWIWNIFEYLTTKKEKIQFIGSIIGYESSDLFIVEISNNNIIKQDNIKGDLIFLENKSHCSVGIIVNEKILLNKKWIHIFLLRKSDDSLISFKSKSFEPLSNQNTIFSKNNSIYLLDIKTLSESIKKEIESNPFYKDFKNLIGYVCSGSTINQIKFNKLFDNKLLKEKGIGEGTIIQTEISKQEVLYQIIDGKTNEENLENKDSHGYVIGTAQKLGSYDFNSNELNTVKWLPENYTPLFLLNPKEILYDPKQFIGKLPNTNYGIQIKNPDELVTHNTAILGILGIGKSVLTFELLQKLIDTTDVKIFCIDLTNQYSKALKDFIDSKLIQEELNQTVLTNLRTNNPNGSPDDPTSWGNEELYKTSLAQEIDTFVNSSARVITLNPDWHSVSKAGSSFRINHKVDLTASEKTRIIIEKIFLKAKSLGETTDARYLIVLEEAHSLVPEWNSVAHDGDKNATNGIAKVILQGRKYGLGSIVITQRTANISKSILNQCNTIFAMRVFDDTGKQFLQNYIGSDYSDLLPTLEERHCIVIGKAMKLKQPVVIELNDMKDIIIPTIN